MNNLIIFFTDPTTGTMKGTNKHHAGIPVLAGPSIITVKQQILLIPFFK